MSDPTSSAVSADSAASSPTTAAPAAPAPSAMDVAVQNLMARKGMQSMQPPATQADEPVTVTTGPAVVTTPAEPAPEPAEPVISAPKNEREYLDRIARKDALYQQARNEGAQLRQQLAEMQRKQDEFYQRFSADPMAVMRERNIRFGDIAMQAAGKTPEGKGKEAQASALPPEVAAEFEELKKFRNEYQQSQQQRAVDDHRNMQIGVIKDALAKDTQIPLVNELGKYGDVLDLVTKHVGHHGAFADEREAEEVVAFYARQIEAQQRRDMLAHATKPGVKAWLAKELGFTAAPSAAPPQREATPARPEIEGNQAQPNPRPALSNTITTQRTTTAGEQPWDKERARQQAVAEMAQIAQASRATH
jgi:hypothetical protein